MVKEGSCVPLYPWALVRKFPKTANEMNLNPDIKKRVSGLTCMAPGESATRMNTVLKYVIRLDLLNCHAKFRGDTISRSRENGVWICYFW